MDNIKYEIIDKEPEPENIDKESESQPEID